MSWDYLKHYMREAQKHPLLSAEEEKELAHQIHHGSKEAKKQAKRQLVQSNLRLVVYLARKHLNRGVSLEDLIQEGNMGLMRAAESFDPLKSKFSTYASWWIWQAMTRAVYNDSSVIRIPIGTAADKESLVKHFNNFLSKWYREPTLEELVELSGFTTERTLCLLSLPSVGLILDAPVAGQENLVVDIIPDESDSLEDFFDECFLIVRCLKLVETLDSRSQTILRLRMQDPPPSFDEIGVEVGLTRERVRQVLVRDLRLLRLRAQKEGLL